MLRLNPSAMNINKQNFFQVFAEAFKPERQPMQTRTEMFENTTALTKHEREILEMAIRHFFDFGKYISRADRIALINASRKVGLAKLSEQMTNDIDL
jgi:hypothetical protein